MRTGSPELVAALEAGQRTYDVQVRLGGRDVTDEVTSWSVERGSDTGLPEQVATPTGSTAAAASVSLSGQGLVTAASRYSPWAPRITADITRPGQSCVLEWGLAEERLQSLRGRVRSVSAHSRSGAADVEVLDGSEMMRGRAWTPPSVWAGTGGGSAIHTQWAVDHALRESGIYTSPPPRTGAIFFASFNGSREANRGIRQSTTQITGYYPAISPWTAGPAVTLGAGPTDTEWSATYAPQKRVLSQANTLMVEWWTHCPAPGAGPRSSMQLVFASRPQGEAGRETTVITVHHDPAARQLRAQAGAWSYTWDLPAGVDQQGRFKVAFMVTLTTTSAPVTIRPWLYQPSGSLYAGETWTSSTTPVWGVLETVTVTATGPVECAGVTPVSGAISVVEPWSRGATVDLVRPEGASSSLTLYALRGLPEVSGTWWDMVKQIATDTMSYVWFDEDGVFRMRPYDYVSPDHDPPDLDLSVTAERSLADVTVTEEIDGVANRIEIGWAPIRQVSSAHSEVYEYNTVFSVQPGAVVEMPIDFQDRTWGMRAPQLFGGIAVPGQSTVGSLVKFVTSTGTLAPVECELVYDSGHPLFRFHNRGSNTAYSALTSARTDPSFRPAHQVAETPQVQPQTRQNLASVARYGVQALEIGASPWVQTQNWADNLSLRLVAWTAWPVPLTGELAILPDPRIQIGDVVHIHDPDGTRIDGVYRVLGYTVAGQGAAVTMTLDVRPLSRPAQPQDSGLSTEPVLDPTVAASLPG